MGELFENIQDLESRVVQVHGEAQQILQTSVTEMIDESLRFDVCSQEAVSSRPDKEVEILDIDDRQLQSLLGPSLLAND